MSKVHLYKPMSASLLQQFVQWVSGAPPEFTDQKFPAAGYGREVRQGSQCECEGQRAWAGDGVGGVGEASHRATGGLRWMKHHTKEAAAGDGHIECT